MRLVPDLAPRPLRPLSRCPPTSLMPHEASSHMRLVGGRRVPHEGATLASLGRHGKMGKLSLDTQGTARSSKQAMDIGAIETLLPALWRLKFATSQL